MRCDVMCITAEWAANLLDTVSLYDNGWIVTVTLNLLLCLEHLILFLRFEQPWRLHCH